MTVTPDVALLNNYAMKKKSVYLKLERSNLTLFPTFLHSSIGDAGAGHVVHINERNAIST